MRNVNNLKAKSLKQEMSTGLEAGPLAEMVVRNGWTITDLLRFHNQVISRAKKIC
jgi:hypothetical protein